jgi:hypothetical protein
MVKRCLTFIPAVLIAGFLFWACEKAMEPRQAVGLTGLTLSVEQVKLPMVSVKIDSVTRDTFYNQTAYRCTVRVSSASWDPATGAPVLFNLYKYFPDGNRYTFAGRIFAGGRNFNRGDTLFYTAENGKPDTLLCKIPAESLVVLGVEDQSPFYLSAAAVTNMESRDANHYFNGFEGERVLHSILWGGSYRPRISLNDNAIYTVSNVVKLNATFNLQGLETSTIDYVRFSTLEPFTLSDILAIDSLLKRAGPADSSTIRYNNYRVRLSDSALLNSTNFVVGKF